MTLSLDGWQASFLEVAVAALAPPSLCRSLGFIQSRVEAPEARVPRYVFLFIYVKLFLSCIEIDNGHGKLFFSLFLLGIVLINEDSIWVFIVVFVIILICLHCQHEPTQMSSSGWCLLSLVMIVMFTYFSVWKLALFFMSAVDVFFAPLTWLCFVK